MQFLADVQMTCPDCQGARYKPEILQVKYRDCSIAEVLEMAVREAIPFFRGQSKVQQRLEMLASVGLDYVALGQSATTLSSGECQRLKLAGHLSGATKRRTLFLLDEPTTGLHTHDVVKLLDCFDALIAAGHSLIIVEHNLHLISAADYIIDIGPGPADQGGCLVACGTPEKIAQNPQSLTGQYLHQFLGRQGISRH
jgi:excinuclease ABC subunit A